MNYCNLIVTCYHGFLSIGNVFTIIHIIRVWNRVWVFIWCSFFSNLFSNQMLCLFALHLFIIQDQKVMFYQSDNFPNAFHALCSFFVGLFAWPWALGCAWVCKLILYAWGYLYQISDFGWGTYHLFGYKLHWSECCKVFGDNWYISNLWCWYYVYNFHTIWTTDLCTEY